MTGRCPAAAVPITPPRLLLTRRAVLPSCLACCRDARPGPHLRHCTDGSRWPSDAGEVTSAGPSALQHGWRPRRASSAPLQNSWQYLLRCVGERVLLLLQIAGPGRRVPDLQPGVGADHDALALQARIVPQAQRDRDPALLVQLFVGGTGEEHPAVVPDGLGRYRRCP